MHCNLYTSMYCLLYNRTAPTWITGILIRDEPPRFQQYDLTVDNVFGWQGYSITKGRFQSVNVEGESLMNIFMNESAARLQKNSCA